MLHSTVKTNKSNRPCALTPFAGPLAGSLCTLPSFPAQASSCLNPEPSNVALSQPQTQLAYSMVKPRVSVLQVLVIQLALSGSCSKKLEDPTPAPGPLGPWPLGPTQALGVWGGECIWEAPGSPGRQPLVLDAICPGFLLSSCRPKE